MKKNVTKKKPTRSWKRSVVKAVTYRCFIMILDFTAIKLFTGSTNVAGGFVIVSNLYTTVAYFIHERLWQGVKWGTA
jgi:adenylylsulfate kinase